MTAGARQLDMLPPHLRRGASLLAISIPLAPMPAQRPRAFAKMRANGTPYAAVYDERRYAAWKRAAAYALGAYKRATEFREPIRAFCIGKVEAVFARPSRKPDGYTIEGEWIPYTFEWTEGRNLYGGVEDKDNLEKAALDAIVAAGLLLDDRLVVEDGGTRKVYAAEGESPCVEIRLWRA